MKIQSALVKAGREDLIGFDKKCLIRPRNIGYGTGNAAKSGQGRNTVSKPWSKDGKQDKKAAPAKKKTIRNVHKSKPKKG